MQKTKQTLTIATRQSPLALWQANFVKQNIELLYPDMTVNLLTMTTKGDKILDTPLAKIGGKGLFVKELENALLSKEADIAVHSLKDVPMILPQGLMIGAYCKRHAPTDAFVSNHFSTLADLPKGAILGTSSLRRECQIRAHRPDIIIKSLRGNVGTRLQKLDEGQFDAIILATSGLQRLGLDERIAHEIASDISLPAVGQGILAIECRHEDDILEIIKPLNDIKTALCAHAERAMNTELEGGCQVPIAGFATLTDNHLTLEGRVGTVDGQTLLKVKQSTLLSDMPQIDAENLGKQVAQNLLAQGAKNILQAIYQSHD